MATDYPVTMAVRVLRQHQVSFSAHLYTWEARGGTRASAEHLGVDEHRVVKTLIFENESKQPLCVLMHGDRQVSTTELARVIGVKTIQPCSPENASRHTGYLVGGTSPFGTRKQLPVYMERTILALPRIYINGGKRGYLVGMAPADAQRLLQPTLVSVATEQGVGRGT